METAVIAAYSEVGTAMMLEFVHPVHVEVAGVQLLGESLNAVRERLAAAGVEVEFDDLGAVIPSLSIGLFAPAGAVERGAAWK